MRPFKYSYFQLTFGQEEAYLHPERTYQRLQRFGYDAIEICPPKGRYGLGVGMERYLETHKQLKADFGLEVSCINECWGEMWDPYSPTYKTLTDPKTAELAVSETKSSIDFAAELDAPFVTIAVAIHDAITPDNLERRHGGCRGCTATGRGLRRHQGRAARLRGDESPGDGQVRQHGAQPQTHDCTHGPR